MHAVGVLGMFYGGRSESADLRSAVETFHLPARKRLIQKKRKFVTRESVRSTYMNRARNREQRRTEGSVVGLVR